MGVLLQTRMSVALAPLELPDRMVTLLPVFLIRTPAGSRVDPELHGAADGHPIEHGGPGEVAQADAGERPGALAGEGDVRGHQRAAKPRPHVDGQLGHGRDPQPRRQGQHQD